MPRVRGTGVSAGAALGTAAIVQMRGGIPLSPRPPEHIANLVATDRLDETLDIVLVVPDLRTAAALADGLPWARVVAIVSESPAQPDVAAQVPAVIGMPGLLDLVEEGALLLVDATSGIVTIDPDGAAIARFQADRNNLAPRRRVHIGSEHIPARTADGRTVLIAAPVTSLEAVDTAIELGADVVCVTEITKLLPPFEPLRDLRRRFDILAARVGGKPLLLCDDYSLPPELILTAADIADLTIAVPLRTDLPGLGLRELAEELRLTLDDLFDRDLAGTMPRLAAIVDLGSPPGDLSWIDALASFGCTRLVVSSQCTEDGAGRLNALDEIVSGANAALLPVFFAPRGTDDDGALKDDLCAAVAVGCAGVLTHRIPDAKRIIGELDYADCREALLNPEPG